MAAEKIECSMLESWIENYRCTISDVNETKSCLISLAELRTLIAYIDSRNINETVNKIDGVRVYFVRPDQNHRKILSLENPVQGRQVNQMSIAIIPTYRYQEKFEKTGHAGAFNYKEKGGANGLIYAVYPGGENSGLCPPNCGE